MPPPPSQSVFSLASTLTDAPPPLAGSQRAAPHTTQGGAPEITIAETTLERTVLVVSSPLPTLEEVTIAGQPAIRVFLGTARHLKQRGCPALPFIRTNLLTADSAAPSLRIVESTHVDQPAAPPVPSLGFIERGDPHQPPPQPFFGTAYTTGAPYPETPARLTEPYNIRRLRGVGVIVTPTQYLPGGNVLRTYTRLVLEVTTPAADSSPQTVASPRSHTFTALASASFANFNTLRADNTNAETNSSGADRGATRESTLQDPLDGLLVVPSTAFTTHLDAFVEWKRQRGLIVKTATYPTDTGSGTTALRNYIKAHYEDADSPISHVILVSDYDGAQEGDDDIPVYQTSPHPSDTLYTTLAGDDDYHDLIISRISANTVEELENQLTKIVNYEKSPQTGAAADWYEKASMVASNEGPGTSAFGKYDWELLNAEKADLLANGFTHVATACDPGATADEVIDTWNAGCSLVYYLGHGTATGWETTGFDVTKATTRLTNGAALPVVLNGNCKNGYFLYSSGDCLAEAIIKAGTPETPAGGIAVLSSTTNMDWDPPIVMIQAFTDYLLEHDPINAGDMTFDGGTVSTLGAHVVLSIHRAMDYCIATPDEGAGAAEKIMQQVHLFGDCTLGLRTQQPHELTVVHAGVITPGQPFDVTVRTSGGTPAADVTVCLYASSDRQYAARTNAQGQVSLQHGFTDSQSATLTVYQRNAVPLQAVVHASGGAPVITSTDSLPTGFVGEEYQFSPSAAGGVAPFTWSLVAGHPAWLTIDPATGMLSGTPDAAATVSATIQVTDSEEPSHTTTQSVSFQVGEPVRIVTDALPSGTVGQSYDQQIKVEGTFTPITFEGGTRALPVGLALSAEGVVQGTPSRAGTFTFNVIARDQQARSDSQDLEIEVSAATSVSIDTSPTLPDASRGESYKVVVLAASGGTGNGFVWQVVEGSLPTGLQLTPSGTIYGTPDADGVFTFTVSVADDQEPPVTTQAEFSLTVNSELYFSSAVLPDATVGAPYSASIDVGGGQPPYAFVPADAQGYSESTGPSTFTETGEKQPWQGDEVEWELDLPFAFTFLGTSHTTCRVGDNGYVVFGNNSPNTFWDATADNLSQLVMIAPFWTDLVITEDYSDTGIFLTQTDSSVTIRWRGRDYHEEQDVVNMAVALHSDGSFRFSYGSIATTNRVIVGFSNGNTDSRIVTYSHTWVEKNPDYVQGWADHDDVFFDPQNALLDWLDLQADGQLTGTPSEAGNVQFAVQVSDAGGDTIVQDLVLSVRPPLEADPNQDGDVDNAEILAFIELWKEGVVVETQVRTAIDLWRAGPPRARNRGTRPQGKPSPRPPKARRVGEILVLELPLENAPDMARRLLGEGYDVARVANAAAEIYATPYEYDALVAAGFSPLITARQYVGDGARAADATASRAAPAGYTNYTDMSAQLQALAQDHPEICRVESIGQSVKGRDLWVVTVSDNPDSREAEPACMYVATMHGDEPIGTELCLRFLDLLIDNYGGADALGQRVTDLVDTTRLAILPCMNPDGLENCTRYNHNGADLNRDFPDGALSDIGTLGMTDSLDLAGRQPETAAVMQWNAQSPSALSISLHSGSFLVCYPFGNNPQQQDINTPTPDDTLFRQLAGIYTTNHTTMATGSAYPGGIINAAQWYAVDGEMGDWNYRYLGMLETTGELSNVKTPNASLLPGLWDDNREAMLSYAEAGHAGVGGVVTDAATASPLWAQVTPLDIDIPTYSHAAGGDYHRVLLPGTYALEFASPGYWTHTEAAVSIAVDSAQRLDVELTPASHTVTRSMHSFYGTPVDALTITLSLQIDEDATPSGVILAESLSGGFTYQSGTTVDANGNALDEPRREGNQCSWLLWGNQVQDGVLSYDLNADAANGPMRVNGKLRVVNGTVPASGPKEWQHTGEYEWTIQLTSGWNLISIPLELSAPGTESIFAPERPAIFGWDGNVYFNATVLEPKSGYWVHSERSQTVTVTGTRPGSSIRSFSQGWNLFGCIDAAAQLDAPELIKPAWGWADSSYNAATQLTPGRGYWGFCTQQVDIPLIPTPR